MIEIGQKLLTLEDFCGVLYKNLKTDISQQALDRIRKSFEFLVEFSKGKVIYGVNTGFGPMSHYKIENKDIKNLQYNLIRSHCSGSGNLLPEIYVAAVMLTRLNTLAKGYSGIHEDAILLLSEMINKKIYPDIYEHGGVGASGDLVQLAHLALALIGEGDASNLGETQPIADIFSNYNLKPIEINIREGLALMNGTSAMTGIGIVNTIQAKNLLNWAVIASAMLNEIVETYDDHISRELNGVKLHEGQNKIAKAMRRLLKTSKLIRKRHEHLFNKKVKESVLNGKVQEYYSLRCIPQILGPVSDAIDNTEKVLINEVNSVSDNPVVDFENENIFHGGNFHGDYISFEMDKLKIAITKLSILSERQLNFLLHDKLNNILPPFINFGTLGLNLGMQGVQYTSTSTVAENQTLSFPMYVHSIPNNNDNQDVVSMGTNSSLLAKKVIDNTYEVLAVEFMAIIQAIDYLKCESKMAETTNRVYHELRNLVPLFVDDTVKYNDLRNLKDYLVQNRLNLV